MVAIVVLFLLVAPVVGSGMPISVVVLQVVSYARDGGTG